MFRIRSYKVTCSILFVAAGSLTVTACGGGGSTNAHPPKVQTHASSGAPSSVAASRTVRIATGVHVTNTPTKAFRVKAVDTTESVALGPSGFPVYTFQGESTEHVICQKTASADTNCWAFWPPVSVSSSSGLNKQAGIAGDLGTFRNQGVLQLTLDGRPLYYFSPDLASKNATQATGDYVKTFGSIWHIVATG